MKQTGDKREREDVWKNMLRCWVQQIFRGNWIPPFVVGNQHNFFPLAWFVCLFGFFGNGDRLE